ncbi:expansin-A18 [Brassica rapa]|uniref:expansin-A18 n=1 Tax=Brassica campestris TaxID=3711 RepID=UPI00142DB269|nr:expansin-A18 [Brassica rapa]
MSLLYCARKGSVQGTGKRMKNESSRPGTSWKRIRRFAIQLQIRVSLWDSMEIEGKIGSLGFAMNGNTEDLKAIMGFREDMECWRQSSFEQHLTGVAKLDMPTIALQPIYTTCILQRDIEKTKKEKMDQSLYSKCLVILSVMGMIGTSSAAYAGGPWRRASATFYGDETARETMGGACGYGNLWNSGYGAATSALSTVLFNDGYSCGQCFQIRCVSSPNCYYGSPATVVTATNICPPNWGQNSNNGGWCNPPRAHFDLTKPAFMKIANWKAGIIPISYRRVACKRTGGIRFKFEGNGYWLLVYVMNVGGAGDIKTMAVKGSRTNWINMSHNWGASYQAFSSLYGQSLSFRLTSYTTRQTIYAWNAAPASWSAGQTYKSNANFS